MGIASAVLPLGSRHLLCESIPGCGSQTSCPAAAETPDSRAEAGDAPMQCEAVTDGWGDLLPAQPSRLMESCGRDYSLQRQGHCLPPATGAAVNAAVEGASTVSCSGYSQWLAAINLSSLTPFWG